MGLQKRFRVRLNEQELRDLLEAVDLKCLQLLEEEMKLKDRIHELVPYKDPSGQSPEFKKAASKSIEARNKIIRLESVELQFKNLLKGKTRGRRQRVPIYLTRLHDWRILSEIREKMKAERRAQECRPLKQ